MIPRANITAWRTDAPWSTDEQVEQDLVLSRALVEIFNNDVLTAALAFRGGTALHKLHIHPPSRFSEDIDLVQTTGGPIGEVMSALRDVLDPWLGKPRYKQGKGRVTFFYRFDSEIPPIVPMRLKVEINTREHFNVMGLRRSPFAMDNAWFSGGADIPSYALEELLGTKLRALYQRKKGRDLCDFWAAFELAPEVEDDEIVRCFNHYMKETAAPVSRAQYEENLAEKKSSPAFRDDIAPLLSERAAADFDFEMAMQQVEERLVAKLPGEPWKGPGQEQADER